ncbi:MAG: hypothetical protein ACOYM4_12025 [Nodosilinea sp.]
MVDKIVPPAFKIWLAFLFMFLLLGYGVVPSILLGALAGLAGGTMTAWWNTLGGEPKASLELPEPIRQFSRSLRATPARLPFKNFFDRGQQRSPRARR